MLKDRPSLQRPVHDAPSYLPQAPLPPRGPSNAAPGGQPPRSPQISRSHADGSATLCAHTPPTSGTRWGGNRTKARERTFPWLCRGSPPPPRLRSGGRLLRDLVPGGGGGGALVRSASRGRGKPSREAASPGGVPRSAPAGGPGRWGRQLRAAVRSRGRPGSRWRLPTPPAQASPAGPEVRKLPASSLLTRPPAAAPWRAGKWEHVPPPPLGYSTRRCFVGLRRRSHGGHGRPPPAPCLTNRSGQGSTAAPREQVRPARDRPARAHWAGARATSGRPGRRGCCGGAHVTPGHQVSGAGLEAPAGARSPWPSVLQSSLNVYDSRSPPSLPHRACRAVFSLSAHIFL